MSKNLTENIFMPIATDILYQYGYNVYIIPRNKTKTPDFIISKDSNEYLVELKIKNDDPKDIEKENQNLLHSKLISKSSPIGPRNRLTGIINSGIKQLIEYDRDNKYYHLLWIHSTGINSSLHNERFHSTLFGTQHLVSMEVENSIFCYYFKESAFYSSKNSLDAVILTYDDGINLNFKLCINTFSSKIEKFRKTLLYKDFSNALCDPVVIENKNGVFIADCDYDRKNEPKIIEYLAQKYNLKHLQSIDMALHSARIVIDD